MCDAVARSPHRVDVEFLPQGLHDLPSADMRSRVQEAVDRTDATAYDAVLLGYGLCNNGLHHIRSPGIPLVLPRAHDCITLFFGSKEKYLEYFHQFPGTYFKTSGWIERGNKPGDLSQFSIERMIGMDQTYEELVGAYGEDNAEYLFDTLCRIHKNYSQFTYIDMGVEPDDRFEQDTRREAEERGWTFRKEQGDMRLIRNLVGGNWGEEDFLVVPPGHRVVARYDEAILASEPVPD